MFISTVDAMHANLNAVSNVLSSPVLFAVLGLVARHMLYLYAVRRTINEGNEDERQSD